MLLSVANAMHTDPLGAFHLHNTEYIPDAQPMSESDWPDPGIVVMRTTLTTAAFDAFRNIQVPAGTQVWAPVRRVTRDAAFFGADFVYAAHDDPVLRDAMQAFFYDPADIEGLAKVELHEEDGWAGMMTFDPLTFGTGEVATEFHPRGATLSDADRQELQQHFLRARGPRTRVKEALLASFGLDKAPSRGRAQAVRTLSEAVWVAQVIAEPRELACIVARVRNALDAVPRRRGAELPADNSSVPAARLPRGAAENECCEGQVVQSSVAWSLRTDPRVLAVMERALDTRVTGLPYDLPFVCTTGDQMRARALDASRPWLVRVGGADPRRMGVLALGPSPTPLPLWTVLPADIGAAAEMADASGNLSAVPSRVEWMEPYRAGKRVSSLAEFVDYLTSNGANQGVVKLSFDVRGLSFRLAYSACPVGHLALWDTARSPFAVSLPPTQMPPARQLVLGLRIGAEPRAPHDPELKTRMTQGLCVEHDPTGRPTGLALSGAEQSRVRGLLPADALPYTGEPAHATFQRDARIQNLLLAIPHMFNDYSVHLRKAVQ